MVELSKKEHKAVDEELAFYTKQYNAGVRGMAVDDVCKSAIKNLMKKGYAFSYEDVLARWDYLTVKAPLPPDVKKLSASEEKHKRILEEWNIARPLAMDYVSKLPKPPNLDEAIVDSIYKSFCKQNEKQANETDIKALLAKFEHNGRAFDLDLEAEERREMRELENKGLVKTRHYDTKIKLKKGNKTEYKEWMVHYYEPTGNVLEEEKEDEFACYANDGVWDRPKQTKA